jgi:hypothetical protein
MLLFSLGVATLVCLNLYARFAIDRSGYGDHQSRLIGS